MGRRCHINEIAAETFERLVKNEDTDLCQGESYFLDKDWYVLYEILHDKNWPLSLAIAGDYRHPGWDYTFEDYNNGLADTYAGFASPVLVRNIEEAFDALPDALVEQWYMAVGVRDAGEVSHLAEIYHNAARRGNGLCIGIV